MVPGQRTQLLERRNRFSLLEAAQLGVVDRFALGYRLLLDLSERVPVALTQPTQVGAQPYRPADLGVLGGPGRAAPRLVASLRVGIHLAHAPPCFDRSYLVLYWSGVLSVKQHVFRTP